MPSALFAEGFFVISILMVISLVLVAYVFLSYVLPFKATWKLKLGLTLFFLVISQKFSFYYYFGGHMFSRQRPSFCFGYRCEQRHGLARALAA